MKNISLLKVLMLELCCFKMLILLFTCNSLTLDGVSVLEIALIIKYIGVIPTSTVYIFYYMLMLVEYVKCTHVALYIVVHIHRLSITHTKTRLGRCVNFALW